MPRKRQTTKSKIVKAAWNLFYKKGYHATTIDDIITASRTSKGSFYHYFKGKDALLGSLAYLFDDKSGKSSKLHRTVGSLLLNAPQTNLFISTRCMNAH